MTKRNPNCFCHVCEKAIYRTPKNIQKGVVFCSLACNGLSRRRDESVKKTTKNVSPLKIALARLRGGVCEKCQYNNFAILNAHHIVEVCNGGGDDLDNLLLLCPNCHALEHVKDSSKNLLDFND